MHYMTVTECRIPAGHMQEFVAQIQQWEQEASASEHAPEFHGVYLQDGDPSLALVLTQFASREAAERFTASGLERRFHERVMPCVASAPVGPRAFDLFYATMADGGRVVFGEDG